MPKAPVAQTTAQKAAAAASANALKRNQACHQCRKKKLKCDAQMPCSACVKTHAFAVRTHPASAPDTPDCTYDGPAAEEAQARVAELEAKIANLEAQMRAQQTMNFNASPGTLSASTPSTMASSSPAFQTASANTSPPTLYATATNSASPVPPRVTSAHLIQDMHKLFELFPDGTGNETSPKSTSEYHYHANSQQTAGYSPPTPESILFSSLTTPGWPKNIPSPELLHHLIDTFFSNVPLANKVIHRPTLMASLTHPTNSARFPATSLLHAICAMASLYTPIVPDKPQSDLTLGSEVLFNSAVAQKRQVWDPEGCRTVDDGRYSIEEGAFGLMHANWYYQEFISCARRGDRILNLLQGSIIMAWYYHSVGRAVDTWMWVGNCVRTLLPMGLNAAMPFTPLSRQPVETLSMYPPASNDLEGEYLRNLCWLAYAMERLYCAGTVWPLTLQDEDVTQYLPVDVSSNAFKFLTLSDRQRLFTPKMMVNHPLAITDSFTIYIKSTVLLGKVKVFNGRFKVKYAEGSSENMDPRDTAEFQLLDNLITSFKMSIPKEFREPCDDNGKLDPVLFMALTVPHVAMLMLHDPHCDPSSPNCLSAERMLSSARLVLDLVFKLTSSSYDLILLDHSSSFCWFVAAVALIRFLKAKILAGDETETGRLTQEIQIMRLMMSSLGARTIVGLRQNMILDEMYMAEIQPLIDRVVSPPTIEELNAAAGFFGVF